MSASHTSATFTAIDAGAVDGWKDYELTLPNGVKVPGKKFLRDVIGSTGCQMSLTSLPEGGAVPFFHAHKQNEEIYIFLKGSGEMQIDGELFPVTEGSIVRIAPAGMRCMRNTGKGELVSIVMQVLQNSLQQDTAGDGVVPETPVQWVK